MPDSVPATPKTKSRKRYTVGFWEDDRDRLETILESIAPDNNPQFPTAKSDRLSLMLDWVEGQLVEPQPQASPDITQRLEDQARAIASLSGHITQLSQQLAQQLTHPELVAHIEQLEQHNQQLTQERDQLQEKFTGIYQTLGLTPPQSSTPVPESAAVVPAATSVPTPEPTGVESIQTKGSPSPKTSPSDPSSSEISSPKPSKTPSPKPSKTPSSKPPKPSASKSSKTRSSKSSKPSASKPSKTPSSKTSSSKISQPQSPPEVASTYGLDPDIVRAIQTIMDHNDRVAQSHDDKWVIAVNPLQQLLSTIGKGTNTKIMKALKQLRPDIDAHHHKHGLSQRHNKCHTGQAISDFIKL
ncbi:MAG: hypothetical protein AB4042_16765 [Leptolyngbyaceae cyanobacterium]